MKANSILETIGNTPHIRMARLFPGAEVWIKSERSNPGGSIKDRIALAMVEAAEAQGRLKPGGVIVEPTSGNTGIALAFVCAAKGYRGRLGDGRCGQGLQADAGDAREHEPRAAAADAGIWRIVRPHA
jgi:threonine dehydratase